MLTNTAFDKMIIESIDQVACYDKETEDLLFVFDQVTDGEITSESDVVYAEGRQGVQLAAFDRNKTAGFTCTNGYVQAGAMAVQLGTDVVNGATTYDVIELVESDGTTAVLSLENAIAGSTPTAKVYKANADGSRGDEVEPDSIANASVTATVYNGTAAYEVGDVVKKTADATTYYKVVTAREAESTDVAFETFVTNNCVETPTHGAGEITLSASPESGAKFIVCYETTTPNGKKILNSGDQFSKNIKVVIDFVAQEPCGGNKYLMQCTMPNAKASGSFSLSAGDNPAVHNFEVSALLDVCSKDKELFTIKMV